MSAAAEARTVQVMVRLTPDEATELAAAAEKFHCSRPDLLRTSFFYLNRFDFPTFTDQGDPSHDRT